MASGGKEQKPRKPPPVELTGDSKVRKEPRKPKEPEETRLPPPDINPQILKTAQQIVEEILVIQQEADGIYKEAMQAKKDGDDTLWQRKLKEAKTRYADILDRWNEEIISQMPSNNDWNEEEVANHYLGKEGSQVNKALENLAYIKKQIRLD